MAIEWYLLKGESSLLSGLDDSGTGFLEESFTEALASAMSDDVELYNYDLSVCTSLKAIVQNNVQDTKLKTQSRQVLVPIGTCKAGMYFKFKNRYWLIVGIVDNNKVYEKALVVWCNHLLTWLNDKGFVVQRWANVSSASQYNNGETYTDHFRTRTDQLMILTPDDEECVMLDSGKRFIIDQRCKIYERKFDSDIMSDTSNPVTVYRLTRPDSVLFDYQDSGHYELMVYQDEQRETDGYYVIDGKGYWLCQEPEIVDDKNMFLTCSIECESPEIYDGLEAGEFTAKFFDTYGNEVDITPNWEIKCDFADMLNVVYVGNTVLISIDNSKLVNKSFELLLSGAGYEPVSIMVTIKAFL